MTEVIDRKSQKGTMPEDDENCSKGQLKPAYQYRVFSKVLASASTTTSRVLIKDEDIKTEDLYFPFYFLRSF